MQITKEIQTSMDDMFATACSQPEFLEKLYGGINLKTRFLITEKETGAFVCAVYADKFVLYHELPKGGHFYSGDNIVASVETERYEVIQSGVLNPKS